MSRPAADLHVLRLCSVFEPPAAPARDGAAVPGELDARTAGFDPIGGMQNHTAVLTRCLEAGVPAVLVNRAEAAARASTVISDDINGMRLAVEHLVG